MTREPTNAPVHLRPHEPVAARVLCPGDPGRALRLAQDLLDAPRMLNHHRGLWGYSGTALDGAQLTVQSTGVGGPSAAAVVHELTGLGARRIVRVGTVTATDAALAPGDALSVTAALAGDGASRALGAPERIMPDPALAAALAAASDRCGVIASTDLFYATDQARTGAVGWDLQTAALLAAAAALGIAAAALCVIAQDACGERLDPEALHAAELRAGRMALAALG